MSNGVNILTSVRVNHFLNCGDVMAETVVALVKRLCDVAGGGRGSAGSAKEQDDLFQCSLKILSR
jgi:hypothetical protein